MSREKPLAPEFGLSLPSCQELFPKDEGTDGFSRARDFQSTVWVGIRFRKDRSSHQAEARELVLMSGECRAAGGAGERDKWKGHGALERTRVAGDGESEGTRDWSRPTLNTAHCHLAEIARQWDAVSIEAMRRVETETSGTPDSDCSSPT